MIFRHSIQLGSYRSRRPPLLYLYDTILHLCDTYTCTISFLKFISALYRMSTRANREPTDWIRGTFHSLPHPRRSGPLGWSHQLIRFMPLTPQDMWEKWIYSAYGPVWVGHKAIWYALQVPFDVYMPFWGSIFHFPAIVFHNFHENWPQSASNSKSWNTKTSEYRATGRPRSSRDAHSVAN